MNISQKIGVSRNTVSSLPVKPEIATFVYNMKYLIVGLGNPGPEYEKTRHNVGFLVLDELAREQGSIWKDERYGWVSEVKYKGRSLTLLKPSTYMNLSGKAVSYWGRKMKLKSPDKILVIVDDIHLPGGVCRLRKKGGSGGHNGLQDIEEKMGRNDYPRIRIGIGNDFYSGQQVDYVLSEWTQEEEEQLPTILRYCVEMILSYVTIGADRTMNQFNK